MANNKKMGPGAKAGLGLAALAAAAGAYYFYGSKHSAQHRRKMKGWMVKARGEVLERMEKMRDLTKEGYNKAIDQVMDKYRKVKTVDTAELAAMANELKRHWNNISREMKKVPAKKKAKK